MSHPSVSCVGNLPANDALDARMSGIVAGESALPHKIVIFALLLHTLRFHSLQGMPGAALVKTQESLQLTC
jgi:hypothetical protein